MKLVIEINLDGAEFTDDCGGEISRILDILSYEASFEDRESLARRAFSPRDLNGNVCGSVRVEE